MVQRIRFILALFLLLTAFCLSSAAAQGVSGELDPEFGAFGENGIVRLNRNIDLSALQSDGKIIVVEQQGVGEADTQIYVRRYFADGRLDSAFLNTTVNVTYGGVTDMVVQPDGKIVVVGWANKISQKDFMIFRVGADGGLDNDFVQPNFTDFNLLEDYATSVALQLDPTGQKVEKIVAAGATRVHNVNSQNWDFAVVRYHADGRLDTSFNGSGMAHTGFGGCYGDDMGYDVVVQPDGKIIVAGQMDDTESVLIGCWKSDRDFGLARYNMDGSLDESFGGDGRINSGFGGIHDEAQHIFLQSDSKIVVAGLTRLDQGFLDDIALIRYHQNGQEDTSFHGNGKFEIDLHLLYDAVLQPDGRLVIMAENPGNYWKGFSLLRFTLDGNPDPTFAGNGSRVYELENASAGDLSLQTDSKFLVSGSLLKDDDTRSGFLTRVHTNGSPVTNNGKVVTSFGPGNDRAYAVAQTADGHIIVAGETETFAAHKQLALTQYDANGTLDGSFGQGGQVIDGLIGTDDAVRDVAVTASGKIVAAGYIGDSNANLAVWQYAADGSPDKSFNDGRGFDTLDFGHGNDYGQVVLLQKDGGLEKIIVVGFANNGQNSNNAVLARWLPDGSLDETFGDEGVVNTPVGPGYTRVRAAALQPDGKIVVAGRFSGDFFAIRYHKNGSRDWDFGNSGLARVEHPGDDEAYAVAVLPSGRIVLAGYAGPLQGQQYSNGDFGLAFLNADGSYCADCGTDPLLVEMNVRTDFGGDETARAIALQSDGRILVAGGEMEDDDPNGRFLIGRFRFNGNQKTKRGYVLDPAFMDEGKGSTPIGLRAKAMDVILDKQNRILVSGFTFDGNEEDFATVRYLNDIIAPPPDNLVFFPGVFR